MKVHRPAGEGAGIVVGVPRGVVRAAVVQVRGTDHRVQVVLPVAAVGGVAAEGAAAFAKCKISASAYLDVRCCRKEHYFNATTSAFIFPIGIGNRRHVGGDLP